MDEFKSWFTSFAQSSTFAILKEKPIAYFCAEFALSDTLPTYAGGLGILAGDYVRELFDEGMPAVGVGLCYRDKYPGKKLNEKEQVFSKEITPQAVGLEEVMSDDGKVLTIKVPIADKDVFARIWKWEHDTIPVYLLDTDCPENDPADRHITHRLYASDKETRLKQELVLGVGGHRVLDALHIAPSLFHMNEGHSAFLALEILRHEMKKRKLGFHDAIKMSLHHVIFTNHTLIAAGNETFSSDLFTFMLNRYASELEVPVHELLALGQIQESTNFSMSLFALRLAGKSNAVSVLHGKNAERIWPEYKIEAVTNGIHIASWDRVKEQEIVSAHKQNKQVLLRTVKELTGSVWPENALILGWARRMVYYKRPLALFGETEQLKELLVSTERPLRIIISGSAHPADDEGIALIEVLREIIKKNFVNQVIYLPEYRKEFAQLLVAGSDVWLNTPVVGSEACGTSGMKAALNGVLPLTTKDGWVAEVDLAKIGWELSTETIHEDVIRALREEVLPEFFGEEQRWQARMRQARELILQQYTTCRMLKDYLEKMYTPVISTSAEHYFGP
jgi:glucan phosphorylase